MRDPTYSCHGFSRRNLIFEDYFLQMLLPFRLIRRIQLSDKYVGAITSSDLFCLPHSTNVIVEFKRQFTKH